MEELENVLYTFKLGTKHPSFGDGYGTFEKCHFHPNLAQIIRK